MLEFESGSNDPMAFILVVILIQFIQTSTMGVGGILLSFGIQFVVGGAIGYVAGKLTVYVVNKMNMNNQSLYGILLLSIVFATFSITDILNGNGYLAVYIAGIIFGNAKIVYRRDITSFMDGITWLLQIIMFIVLGLLVNPHEILDIALFATLIGIFLIIIGRPLSVLLCLLPFRKLKLKSKIYVSWLGLRGAVPILFATYPVVANIEGSTQIFNIVFFITILSLILQGTTVTFVANLLGLATPLKEKDSEFGVEMPEEIDTHLSDIVLTEDMLIHGDRLMDLSIPQGTLIILVKRNNEFIIPNGSLHLHVGDKLLTMSAKDDDKK